VCDDGRLPPIEALVVTGGEERTTPAKLATSPGGGRALPDRGVPSSSHITENDQLMAVRELWRFVEPGSGCCPAVLRGAYSPLMEFEVPGQ
jgi:hypothetical protein